MSPRKPTARGSSKSGKKGSRGATAKAPTSKRAKAGRTRAPNADAAAPKTGRPRKPFSRHEFEKLCRIQSTIEEIACWFDCDVDTVQKKVQAEYGAPFSVVFRRYRGHGKVSLRRRQFQKALEGDSRMLKYLGANWLGQRERVEYLSSEEAKLALAESLGVSPDELPDSGGPSTGV